MSSAYDNLKADRIRFGAYTAFLKYEEADIKNVADAGIDTAIVHADDIPVEKREEFFSNLEKYGVEAIVVSRETRKYYEKAAMLDFDKKDLMWYKDMPAFKYYCYVDEPGTEHFEVLGKEVERFNKEFPGKVAYINLLPMYANAAQLTGGAWKAPIEYYEQPSTDFQQYLDQYVEKVPTHYICTDIYPHRKARNPKCPEKFPAEYIKTTYPNYVKSIEITADKCRECGRDFWVCVQTCSWSSGIREPDEYEFRWQAYTMLSYGAKTLLYYVFAARPRHTGTPLNVRDERNELYFGIKRIAEEFKRMSDVYVSYKNLGAFNVNSTPEATPYLEMNNPYKNFKAISEIKTESPVLVGCFEKKEGKGHAFTLVNMHDFAKPASATIKVKIAGEVNAYYDGTPTKLTSSDGWYEFKLVQGDGVFVTVD